MPATTQLCPALCDPTEQQCIRARRITDDITGEPMLELEWWDSFHGKHSYLSVRFSEWREFASIVHDELMR